MPRDFKPSEVVIVTPPLTGSMSKLECEVAACPVANNDEYLQLLEVLYRARSELKQ